MTDYHGDGENTADAIKYWMARAEVAEDERDQLRHFYNQLCESFAVLWPMEARLAAVIALCEEHRAQTFGIGWFADKVRAAAAGDEG